MSPQVKELEAKNRTIAATFRLSTLLTQQVGLDEILRAILESAEKELGFSASCLFLINEDREHLDCIETRVVRSGKVVHFAHSLDDPRATPIGRMETMMEGD